MEQLQGNVRTITFHSDKNGYSVFTLSMKDDWITCVGYIEPLCEGDFITAEGHYVEHEKYGRQFKASKLTRDIPHDSSMYAQFLQMTMKGVGPKLSQRIVAAFGEDTLKIIEESPMLLTKVQGVTKKRAESIAAQYMEKVGSKDENLFFLSLGITPALAAKIRAHYGDEYKKVLTENPYQLTDTIRGIGFRKADEIASKSGIPKDSAYRLRYGLLFQLKADANMKGYTYCPEDMLIQETSSLLGVDPGLIRNNLYKLEDEQRVVITNDSVYLRSLFDAEKRISQKLADISSCFFRSTHPGDSQPSSLNAEIRHVEKEKGKELDDMQREAVKMAATNGVCVITGGPGTGKTTTLDVLIGYLLKQGKRISLAAPTGRAAKRMSEAIKLPAKTIHRLVLEVRNLDDMDTVDNDMNEELVDNNQTLDTDVIVLDEMSMVDTYVMDMFLKVVDAGTSLVLVGDIDQLPSVGPGNVLKDIIRSGLFPVTRLSKIHRQSEESHIVTYAHDINNGRKINLSDKKQDFFLIERETHEQVKAFMKPMILTSIPRFFKISPFEVQILSAMKKGPLGTIALNQDMQEWLNPPSAEKKELKAGDIIYREGDKVMHIRNNYHLKWTSPKSTGLGVFNGEMGVIQKIDPDEGMVSVLYDEGRVAVYDRENLNELELAYAITIHKSQGSEFPVVVMPLLNSGPPMLCNRNLLYTGITRAKQCDAIIGSSKAFHSMAANTRAAVRYSGLAEKLAGYA